jgi:lipopolysaccharide/colanic/teichoic acid biosynthesis glycosyltransferase
MMNYQVETSGAVAIESDAEMNSYIEYNILTQAESQRLQISQIAYSATKRCLDIFIALSALVILSPLMALVYFAIRITDLGPGIFTQTRVGKDGREFRCLKFRSMVTDAERLKQELLEQNKHNDHRSFKLDSDPRITWIGKFIRKTSIDELPQLLNVLCGDMSIVGPRPPVPSEVALYSNYDRQRLAVKPGLTCLWQVSGRGNLPFTEQVRLDIEYIEKQTLLYDMYLIVMTIPAVCLGRGAY